MPKKPDIGAALGRHRPAAVIDHEMESSIFGKEVQESAPPINLQMANIVPSMFQQRARMSEDHIEDLMESIIESGLITPIVVRKLSTIADSSTSYYDTFEIVAGHHRVEAFRRLGREAIPGLVRVMTDKEAACALTVDNTLHSELTDWELFKHMRMLRSWKFVVTKTAMAAVMGRSRAVIYQLDAFGVLPESACALLDANPSLVGGNLAYELKQPSMDHPELVTQAIEQLAAGKIRQSSVLGWIAHKLAPRVVPYRKESSIKGEYAEVKIVTLGGEAKISGDIDFEKLHKLIAENIDSLRKLPESKPLEPQG